MRLCFRSISHLRWILLLLNVVFQMYNIICKTMLLAVAATTGDVVNNNIVERNEVVAFVRSSSHLGTFVFRRCHFTLDCSPGRAQTGQVRGDESPQFLELRIVMPNCL